MRFWLYCSAEQGSRHRSKEISGVIFRGYLSKGEGLGKDAQLPGASNGFGPIGDIQFSIDADCVSFDGTQGYDELLGNLLIGPTQGHEMEHFQLALA